MSPSSTITSSGTSRTRTVSETASLMDRAVLTRPKPTASSAAGCGKQRNASARSPRLTNQNHLLFNLLGIIPILCFSGFHVRKKVAQRIGIGSRFLHAGHPFVRRVLVSVRAKRPSSSSSAESTARLPAGLHFGGLTSPGFRALLDVVCRRPIVGSANLGDGVTVPRHLQPQRVLDRISVGILEDLVEHLRILVREPVQRSVLHHAVDVPIPRILGQFRARGLVDLAHLVALFELTSHHVPEYLGRHPADQSGK